MSLYTSQYPSGLLARQGYARYWALIRSEDAGSILEKGELMDRNFALEFVRVSESAAIAASRFQGRGNEKAADHAAVEAMRKAFDAISFEGTVKIGEGERDEAPMLYIGEKVGARNGAVKLDLAIDPLEGTTITAKGGANALAVIAAAEDGKFLHAPDTYMRKIAVGKEAFGHISLAKSPTENLNAIAKAKGKSISEVTVVILDRPRHRELIAEVRESGARIKLVLDGDVQAALSTGMADGADVLMGVGGAPEGVIAAAGLKCLGGDFQAQLSFRTDSERRRARSMGIVDLDKIYTRDELASGRVLFCATGVTDGAMLRGVTFCGGGKIRTHSVVMRSETGTVRYIDAIHDTHHKPKNFLS